MAFILYLGNKTNIHTLGESIMETHLIPEELTFLEDNSTSSSGKYIFTIVFLYNLFSILISFVFKMVKSERKIFLYFKHIYTEIYYKIFLFSVLYKKNFKLVKIPTCCE